MTSPSPSPNLNPSASCVVHVRQLCKRYGASTVFEHVDLDVHAGEFVAIVGDSGVGKSTLLNCLAGLDSWSAGSVHLCGEDLATLSDDACALLRRRAVGFVFQAFHVLPHLSVAQNVAVPLMLQGSPGPARAVLVAKALADVGLAELAERTPAQLSGGQLQRVAIARAIVHRPALILADEPTGNLDPHTAAMVLDVLLAQAHAHGAALVLVTHSDAAAKRADRRIRLVAAGAQAEPTLGLSA